MNNLPQYYDALFKQRVVEYYLQNQPNVSFRYVANIFQIKGGHTTVKRWFDKYDGTLVLLQHQHRSGRPRILNKQQVNDLITEVVRSHNRLSRVINFSEITNFIRQKANITISLQTVQLYGQNSGIKWKKS